jgi:hypothetical protein
MTFDIDDEFPAPSQTSKSRKRNRSAAESEVSDVEDFFVDSIKKSSKSTKTKVRVAWKCMPPRFSPAFLSVVEMKHF